MKIIFFGTPHIAAKILESLMMHHEVVAVVTKPDKKQGRDLQLRPSAVKLWVEANCPHIPVLQPLKISTEEYREKLTQFNADIFVVVAYGEIIKQFILDLPPLGCINIHASLLPKYRGAAPMHRAIINGEKETGVSIMEMVLALDAGPILHVEKTPITDEMTVGELEKKLEVLGAEGLLKTLEQIHQKKIHKSYQDDSLATYAAKITPEECEIKWTRSALSIHNLIRGVTPAPGAWCWIFLKNQTEPKRLKIKKSILLQKTSSASPGSIICYDKTSWEVAAGEGVLRILEVQLEGKKSVTAEEFMKGYQGVNFAL